MKILNWIKDNLLFVFTVFLLAFIPLYPKLPIINVQHTWVYVRLEDFVIVLAIIVWAALLLLRKATLKTPLTIPIMLFWVIGGIATLHGVLLLFPTIANVFSNVAFFSFLRRVEYMSLFFIAFSGIKDKKFITYVAVTLTITLLLVVGYGFGQKYLGFPAFLTMNEEFAKGIPIQLSDLARVPSTFAGQYDLAAYLVLIIPLLVSLAFGFKNIIVKIVLLLTSGLGFILLFMTVSRISFFALLLSLLLLFILQKKKIIILSLLALTFALLVFSPSLLQRFKSTVTEVNVLVNAGTGAAVGEVREVPASYFKDKIIEIIPAPNSSLSTSSGSALVMLPSLIPPIAPLVIEANNNSTGESLPQGTSYVDLPLSPVVKKVDQYFSQKLTVKDGIQSEKISVSYGDFLIKKAKAYDLSFTTRFQGEWPNTFTAFMRNIFIGSGYGSVSLAVDNNYLRILGESGLLGFMAFISIFIAAFIYIKKLLADVDSAVVKSFVIGFAAGSFGLAVNATLIDVFEASKIAFTYWLLMGVVIGTLSLYRKDNVDLFKGFKEAVTSPVAIVIYILIVVSAFFSSMVSNYFVGDDFTWLRWASTTSHNLSSYFTQADGFFYRPGTKLYFSAMYSIVWLNQTMYHLVSILLHFGVSVLAFLIFRKIFKNYVMAVVGVGLFLMLAGYHEIVFWIAATGHLFNALFILLGLLFFISWREKQKIIYLVASVVSIILSMLFHELGIVAPLLIILYDLIFVEKSALSRFSRKSIYSILLLPVLPYLGFRFLAQSHWFNGDYSYNLLKLPYNVLGNALGYLSLDLLGPQSLSFYEQLRSLSRTHLVMAIPIFLVIILGLTIVYKLIMRKIEREDRKILIFGFLFFLIALLPFLGFGNITSRYSYLSSIGFVILLTYLLKKAYLLLVNISDKRIGTMCVLIIAIVYVMFQSFELQKLKSDWKFAGSKAEKFLISIEEHSQDSWMRQAQEFYFVDLPIRNGEAWIWPVGLKDALWLAFKNPDLAVNTSTSVESALSLTASSPSAHVFKFNDDGSVDEYVRAKSGQIELLYPQK